MSRPESFEVRRASKENGTRHLVSYKGWKFSGALLPFLPVAKTQHAELGDGTPIPILYEDRAVLALDKPAGWMLAPETWDRTGRNLHLAILSSINAGDFWARSRNLKFLRFAHRLDAETTGVLLLVKSPGAVAVYSRLFESRAVEKRYLAVVEGKPAKTEWICRLSITPDSSRKGRMRTIDPGRKTRDGAQIKEAETHFRVLQTKGERSLVEARPLTGRTHQIRVHLAVAGHPVVGDEIYNPRADSELPTQFPLGLRAVLLRYPDPFQRRPIAIEAPAEPFVKAFGFDCERAPSRIRSHREADREE